ncbi:DUF5808 domain-containing protein [Chryseobacterium hagamense]|uniref:DUF5808 domain-containing protein n=1 Tax=Chryseobacterium hagamense TaxID=395935 RepID=UPI0011BF7185
MNFSDKNPSFWKFGLFYYNKEDKRIFPPKRYGLGWTVNFADPHSVIMFSIIVAAMFLIGYFLKH